jgi:hypothetical protein
MSVKRNVTDPDSGSSRHEDADSPVTSLPPLLLADADVPPLIGGISIRAREDDHCCQNPALSRQGILPMVSLQRYQRNPAVRDRD